MNLRDKIAHMLVREDAEIWVHIHDDKVYRIEVIGNETLPFQDTFKDILELEEAKMVEEIYNDDETIRYKLTKFGKLAGRAMGGY